MSSGNNDWCTIESDPGVFTELMENLGVVGVEVDEIWSLDDDSLDQLVHACDVYGLVFLFKWTRSHYGTDAKKEDKEGEDESSRKPLTEIPENLFFAKQTVTNACATQAILSVLFNMDENDNGANEDKKEKRSSASLGKVLTEFKSFTKHFPPDLKGESIGSSDDIRTVHNSFTRKDMFSLDDPTKPKRIATDDDDVFHFIAYVPKDKTVYELDGLQEGPIIVGNVDKSSSESEQESSSSNSKTLDWLKVARKAIQKRIELYSTNEIKFNLMAITQDRRIKLNEEMMKETHLSKGDDADTLKVNDIQMKLDEQNNKRLQWKKENERRKHNYLPLCIELLKLLAEKDDLNTLATEARERMIEQRKIAAGKK